MALEFLLIRLDLDFVQWSILQGSIKANPILFHGAAFSIVFDALINNMMLN